MHCPLPMAQPNTVSEKWCTCDDDGGSSVVSRDGCKQRGREEEGRGEL